MTDEEVGKMVRGLLGADLDPREWSSGRKGSSGVGGAVETVQVSDRLLQLVSVEDIIEASTRCGVGCARRGRRCLRTRLLLRLVESLLSRILRLLPKAGHGLWLLLEKIFLHCSRRLLLILGARRPHLTADRSDRCLWVVPQGKVGSIVGVHVCLLLLLLRLLLLLLLSLLLLLLLLLLTRTVATQPVVNSSTASPRLALDGINWASVILLATQLLL